MHVNLESVHSILDTAQREGRNVLLEHETYALLKAAGLSSVPEFKIVAPGNLINESDIKQFSGNTVVLKVVAPTISHKTDVGGVRIVPNNADSVNQALREMIETIPARYAQWLSNLGSHTTDNPLVASTSEIESSCRNDIRGIMICEFVPSIRSGFGYEMLIGIQWSREFGPVITAGIGGVDTEMLADSMKSGRASVSASIIESSPESFLKEFRSTLVYRKISGLTRGGSSVTSDRQLLDLFSALFELNRIMGPSGTGRYRLNELEINPFVFSATGIVPIDGLCSFTLRQPERISSPVSKITNLLHPNSMAIIGVSSSKLNMGRIILRNVKKNGFNTKHLYVVRAGESHIDDIPCVPSIEELPEKVDVLVLAIDAAQAPETIRSAAESGKVESVIIIPGGLGEKSGTEAIVEGMNAAIASSRKRSDCGPVFVGGNCLGILSRPGNYDTLFVPDEKLPKNYDRQPDPVAFLSQSGARMITVMSNHANMSPQFAISTGNQMDLGISDFLEHMVDHEPDIKVFAVYVEGFRDLGGLKMIRTVKRLIDQDRPVIFYKAGRTSAGRSATSGHTASIAGSYTICESLMKQAGAIVCNDFTEFNEMTRLAVALREKRLTGNRLAAISNAGYETVGIADNIEGEHHLILASYSESTRQKLTEILVNGRIDKLVDIRNPMDVTPMGNDEVHGSIIEAQLSDPAIDCVIAATVPLTPAQQTLPAGQFGREDFENSGSYPNRIADLFRSTEKPMIAVIDSGIIYDPMVRKMEKAGVVVFRTADLAVRMLSKYIGVRLAGRRNSE